MANNEKNLTKYGKDKPVLSHEEAKKNGKKGAKKKKKLKKEKIIEEKQRVLFKDLFIELVQKPFTKKNDFTKKKQLSKSLKKLFPDKEEEDFNHMIALYSGLFRTAIKGGKGSVSAFTAIRDTMGEKPIDKQEMNQVNLNVAVDKEDLKEAGINIKKMLEDNNF